MCVQYFKAVGTLPKAQQRRSWPAMLLRRVEEYLPNLHFRSERLHFRVCHLVTSPRGGQVGVTSPRGGQEIVAARSQGGAARAMVSPTHPRGVDAGGRTMRLSTSSW